MQRRVFLRSLSFISAAAAGAGLALWHWGDGRRTRPVQTRVFGSARRRKVIAAVMERMLPGAGAAGGIDYVEYWLARHPYDRWQRSFNLGALYLSQQAVRRYRRPFVECSESQQDALLDALRRGAAQSRQFDGRGFFEKLMMLTLESYFGHPKYGGNRDQVGWKLAGWRWSNH